MTETEAPISIQDLRKSYRNGFTAVDGLSLDVRKGSFTGLLGPNGAGKSTTLKIASGLVPPTSGRVLLNGFDVASEHRKALKDVGTVIETPEYYAYLTPRETFSYIGRVIGMSRESVAAQTDSLLEEVRMSEWEDKRIGTFSKGMRQRISIALALLNDPNVIILDEPTSGLDPRGMAEMREILKNIRNGKPGLTVLMSSHMMHEVTDLCDRIAMVNRGRLLVHDDKEKVIGGSGDEHRLSIRLAGGASPEALEAVRSEVCIESAEVSGTAIEAVMRGNDDSAADLIAALVARGLRPCSVSEDENALENRYLEMIQESG